MRTPNIEHRTPNIEVRKRQSSQEGKATLNRNQLREFGNNGKGQKWDLEVRLLEFAAEIIRLVESLPKSRAGTHLGGQLMRSGTSPLLNHGEAESAESPEDFIHKLRICLKELRETLRCLKLIERVPLLADLHSIRNLQRENDELIRIFVSSVRTTTTRSSVGRRS